MQLDRSGSTPLYVQLTDLLREQIARGDWGPGQKIPSENGLNQMYGISRVTARQVLTQLVHEQLLVRVPGKGTFVAAPATGASSPAYPGVRQQLERTGEGITTEVLPGEVGPADRPVADRLGIGSDELVHRLRWVRLVQGEPVGVHDSFVPVRLAPELTTADLVHRQLCVVLLDRYQLRMSRVEESVESTLPTPEDARLLRVRRSTPVLRLHQGIWDGAGRPFEYSRIVVRGDRIRLRFHYDLSASAGRPPVR